MNVIKMLVKIAFALNLEWKIESVGILINTKKYPIGSVSLNNPNTTPYILELHHSNSQDFQ